MIININKDKIKIKKSITHPIFQPLTDSILELIEITGKGIQKSHNSEFSEFTDKNSIDVAYIRILKNELELFINNKNTSKINFPINYSRNSFINKFKEILELKQEHKEEITEGVIYKFIPISPKEKNKQDHCSITDYSNDHSIASELYSIEESKRSVEITSLSLGTKTIINKRSNCIQYFSGSNNLVSIPFDIIESLDVRVTQIRSGTPGDEIVGLLVVKTINEEEFNIFSTKKNEEHHFDFQSKIIEREILAVKTEIDFIILDIIDNNLKNLDPEHLNNITD